MKSKPYQVNQSADYYWEDVFDYGTIYGFENTTAEQPRPDEYPIESWGWNNNPD